MRQWSNLFFFACLVVVPACRAQSITVHLIDARTGNVVANRALWIYVTENPWLTKEHPYEVWTGPDGVAKFPLPSPFPQHLSISIASSDVDACGFDTFSLQEVLHAGAMGNKAKCDPKGKLDGKFSAKPGEIVVFGRKLRWWERGKT